MCEGLKRVSPLFWKIIKASLETDSNSYDGNGFVVTDRSQVFHSIYQDHPCSDWDDHLGKNLIQKSFIQFIGGHDKFDVKPRIKITGINVEKYIIFGPFTIDPEESVNQWLELEGTSFFNINGYENMTPEEKGKVSPYIKVNIICTISYGIHIIWIISYGS